MNAPLRKIIVTKAERYVAQLAGDPDLFAGNSLAEAVGYLICAKATVLGFDIEQITIDTTPSPPS